MFVLKLFHFRNLFNSKNLVLDEVFTKYLHTTKLCAANISFNLSDIGEGIREVVVKEWYVQAGDRVQQFDNICEVQSDKASVTITSRYDGIVKKLHYQIDEVAFVGKPLVDIETDEEELTPAIATTSENNLKQDPIAAQQSTRNDQILAIPSVRRLAKQYNVDLAKVTASGKKGRILKEDLLKYLNLESDSANQKTELQPAEHVIPIKGFQKAMVKTMTEALKIPHFVYSDEVITTKLTKLRQELQELPADDEPIKLSFMPFFIKAASNALLRCPILNASVDEMCENVIMHDTHNIGIAMATKEGLAVPVIRNVNKLGILEIHKELRRLLMTGKNGTFATSDLTGATFTISNIGIIGGTYTKPVILPPQVAIIAIGAAKVLPRFDANRNLVAEEIVCVSGSADHRIVDGVTMAKFVERFKKQIENPYLLFMNLG